MLSLDRLLGTWGSVSKHYMSMWCLGALMFALGLFYALRCIWDRSNVSVLTSINTARVHWSDNVVPLVMAVSLLLLSLYSSPLHMRGGVSNEDIPWDKCDLKYGGYALNHWGVACLWWTSLGLNKEGRLLLMLKCWSRIDLNVSRIWLSCFD